MIRIYLVIGFVFFSVLLSSQYKNCYDRNNKIGIEGNCYETKNYDENNGFTKKGALNPYTTEIRFNHIMFDEIGNNLK